MWTIAYYKIAIPCDVTPEYCPICELMKALGINSASAAQPISLATGDVYIRQNDIRIPGLGGGLALDRTWNSMWPSTQSALNGGMFGPNWRATYEERIFVDSNDHFIRYSRAEGGYWIFAYAGANPSPDNTFNYIPTSPRKAVAVLKTGDPTWTLTFQNGEQRLFDRIGGTHQGKLMAIIDRNGNTTSLTYDGANRLTTVTDPAGRHLYFSYGAAQNMLYLVTSVASDPAAGLTVTYTYDPVTLLLMKVTNPDATFVTFEYNAQNLISAVKDTQGKILESHTYDVLGRAASSSRANGVDAVTVVYPVLYQ